MQKRYSIGKHIVIVTRKEQIDILRMPFRGHRKVVKKFLVFYLSMLYT